MTIFATLGIQFFSVVSSTILISFVVFVLYCLLFSSVVIFLFCLFFSFTVTASVASCRVEKYRGDCVVAAVNHHRHTIPRSSSTPGPVAGDAMWRRSGPFHREHPDPGQILPIFPVSRCIVVVASTSLCGEFVDSIHRGRHELALASDVCCSRRNVRAVRYCTRPNIELG